MRNPVGPIERALRRAYRLEFVLVMVNGINAYGMAHLRRFNEDNVHLNRTFRDPTEP